MWIGQILLGLVFTMVGLAKLTGGPEISSMFENWGYPANFRYVVGAFEFLFGLGLFIPKTAKYAAMGLIGVMTGAFFTHLFNAEFERLLINIGFASILGGIAYARASLRLEKT